MVPHFPQVHKVRVAVEVDKALRTREDTGAAPHASVLRIRDCNERAARLGTVAGSGARQRSTVAHPDVVPRRHVRPAPPRDGQAQPVHHAGPAAAAAALGPAGDEVRGAGAKACIHAPARKAACAAVRSLASGGCSGQCHVPAREKPSERARRAPTTRPPSAAQSGHVSSGTGSSSMTSVLSQGPSILVRAAL